MMALVLKAIIYVLLRKPSRALPVLALKPNYLDRWPNDCSAHTSKTCDTVFTELEGFYCKRYQAILKENCLN